MIIALLIVAIILFLLAASGFSGPAPTVWERIAWLGLAFFAGSFVWGLVFK